MWYPKTIDIAWICGIKPICYAGYHIRWVLVPSAWTKSSTTAFMWTTYPMPIYQGLRCWCWLLSQLIIKLDICWTLQIACSKDQKQNTLRMLKVIWNGLALRHSVQAFPSNNGLHSASSWDWRHCLRKLLHGPLQVGCVSQPICLRGSGWENEGA